MKKVCKNCLHYGVIPTKQAVIDHPMMANPGELKGCNANNDVGVTGESFGEDPKNPCPGDFKEIR